jgi:hypothetical protein
MAVQSSGDIVVVGQQVTFTQSGSVTVNGLARLTPSGALDATFGNGGTVVNSVPAGAQGLKAVAIQPADGKIVTVEPRITLRAGSQPVSGSIVS